jgi:hypothetical protein
MDDRDELFTWVERLGSLTIQEEELVTAMPVQDGDRKSWIVGRTCFSGPVG